MLFELFADDAFALVHVGGKKLTPQRFQHHVTGRSGNQSQDFRRFHYLEQVGELETQVARDLVAVLAPAAVLEMLEQAEDPRQLAVGNRMNQRWRRGRHQARSSISEKTLSVRLLKGSERRSRGRARSTLISPTSRPGPVESTNMRSASSTASSMMWVTIMMVSTGLSAACHRSSNSSRRPIAVRASSAENGSSLSNTAGAPRRAPAAASRLRVGAGRLPRTRRALPYRCRGLRAARARQAGCRAPRGRVRCWLSH